MDEYYFYLYIDTCCDASYRIMYSKKAP